MNSKVYFCIECYEYVRDNEEIIAHNALTDHNRYLLRDDIDKDHYFESEVKTIEDIINKP